MPKRLPLSEVRILQLTVELNRTKDRLENALKLVSRDALTGLASRVRIIEEIEHYLAIFRRERLSGESPSHFSVLFIDLDGFKPINDNVGHGAGDKALQQFAEYLTASVREGDVPGRMGGDEFVVLATGLTKEGARKLATNIEVGLASFPIVADGKTFSLGASIGVSSTSEGLETKADLLHKADLCMLERKKKKKCPR